MTAKTRLGEAGYGVRRYGSFANKTGTAVSAAVGMTGGGGRRMTRSEFERRLQEQRDNTPSRRRFAELIAAEKAAQEAARNAKTEEQRSELQQAANAVELLVDEIADVGIFPDAVDDLLKAFKEAEEAREASKSIAAAREAARRAQTIAHAALAWMHALNDDDEAITLLLLS